MNRSELINKAVEIAINDMQNIGASEKAIRKEAETMTDSELITYIAENTEEGENNNV